MTDLPTAPDASGQQNGLDRFRNVGFPELAAAFMACRNKNTWTARRRDLELFSAWLHAESTAAAAKQLLEGGRGRANLIAHAWKQELVEQRLSPSTINRRLTTIRSLTELAGRLGMIEWKLSVDNVPHQDYRDTSGPGESGYKKLIATLDARDDGPAVRRDRAIVCLLYGLALRRAEVRGLDLEDLDFTRGKIRVLRKGKTEPELLTLPEEIADVLRSWLELRGPDQGALFVSYDPAGKGDGRLCMSSVTRLVRKLGKASEIEVWPHALRHAAITETLRRSNGNVQKAQKFAGHAKPETTMRYDDNRRDLAGEAATDLQLGLKDGADEAGS